MRDCILCCDWGTSSFRLRLVNLHDRQIRGETLSNEGIATTFSSWQAASTQHGAARAGFYQRQLQGHIDALADSLNTDLDKVPLVISGMASSSIGMKELAYAALPFNLDGSAALVEYEEGQADFPHDVLLLSGVRSRQDVMRGEETQLMGLMDLLDLPTGTAGDMVFVFPGTHSKHIKVRHQEIVAFKTFMTGEVFDLLANQSILKDSVKSSGGTELSETDIEGFRQGVQESGKAHLLHAMFKVRTNQLFSTRSKEENYFYMSGLLIGAELRDLLQAPESQVMLCSGSNLYSLYSLALEALGLSRRTVPVSPELIDQCAVVGQVKVYLHHAKHK